MYCGGHQCAPPLCGCCSKTLALLGLLDLRGAVEDGVEPVDALDVVRPEAHATLGDHADARRGHARQARHVVAQVVLGDEADLEAAAVLVDVVDEGLGEVRRHVAGHALLLGGLGLERVHHVGDVDLLRAADRAEVAAHAHPGRVAVHDLVAGAGADEGEDLPRRVVHVRVRGAGPAAGAALDAGLKTGVGRDHGDDFLLEGRRALAPDRGWRWRNCCLWHRLSPLVLKRPRAARDGDRGRVFGRLCVRHGPRLGSSGTPGGKPPVARAIRLPRSLCLAARSQTGPNRPHRLRRCAPRIRFHRDRP